MPQCNQACPLFQVRKLRQQVIDSRPDILGLRGAQVSLQNARPQAHMQTRASMQALLRHSSPHTTQHTCLQHLCSTRCSTTELKKPSLRTHAPTRQHTPHHHACTCTTHTRAHTHTHTHAHTYRETHREREGGRETYEWVLTVEFLSGCQKLGDPLPVTAVQKRVHVHTYTQTRVHVHTYTLTSAC